MERRARDADKQGGDAMTTLPAPGREPRPKSIKLIAFFGILSAVVGLIFSAAWPALPEHHDSHDLFSRIWGIVGLPLDAALLIGSLGILWAKLWARRCLMRWAIFAAIYSTVQLAVTILWIAPHATSRDAGMSDLGDVAAQLGPQFSDLYSTIVSAGAWILWISNMSLVVWIPWVLTRPKIRPFFEPK